MPQSAQKGFIYKKKKYWAIQYNTIQENRKIILADLNIKQEEMS